MNDSRYFLLCMFLVCYKKSIMQLNMMLFEK